MVAYFFSQHGVGAFNTTNLENWSWYGTMFFVGLNSTMVELFLPPGGWAKFMSSLQVEGPRRLGFGSCCFWTGDSKFETFSVHFKFEVSGSRR